MRQAGETIREVAKKHGIETRRPSSSGPTVRVSDTNLAKMLRALGVSVPEVAADHADACYLPVGLRERPAWGISLQLYELRSDRNWGMGDFADLWNFCAFAAELGADFVGLNPLHAGFLSDPDRCSPYEPSNRRFLNPLYIAVDEIGGFADGAELENLLKPLREGVLVDYKRVAEIKLSYLRELWKRQRGEPNFAFAAFVAGGAADLHRHALFETISREMSALGHGAGWKSWPPGYQTVGTPEVKKLEQTHADEIDFHKWLQWCAHVQLAEAKERALNSGMRIGLYLDLAVGEAMDGSATWSEPGHYVSGAAIGNPPEPFAVEGQDWRLAAVLPDIITDGEHSPFERMLTASMKYAGAIRIDHAAAFARLFLVPTDGVPADGAYVAYPTRKMLHTLAEASQSQRCLVVGEDLGNIADGLKEDLGDVDVLSYRILSYEQDVDGFVARESYPETALACVSTHDHQTFRGWWEEADIDLRLEHGLVTPEVSQVHRDVRGKEREDLLRELERSGTIKDPDDVRLSTPDLVIASYKFVASTPCMLVSVRLADMTDEVAATNIPGTDKSYPNWRPRLSYTIDELSSLSLVFQITEAMRATRPRWKVKFAQAPD